MSTAECERLALHIRRMLDSEALSDADGAALLTLGEAAVRALSAGDVAGCRSQVRQVVRLARALLRADALAPAEGYAVLRVARQVLGARGQGASARASATAASISRIRPDSQDAASASAPSASPIACLSAS